MTTSQSHWPAGLAAVGAIRFTRRSANFTATVAFYRDLVGLPLYMTFEHSYGSTGAIFGMPGSALTLEIIEATQPVAIDDHPEQLCLYFPNQKEQRAATQRLRAAGEQPVQSHPFWAATGAETYRDPDGREIVIAPFVFGVDVPPASLASGRHWWPEQPE